VRPSYHIIIAEDQADVRALLVRVVARTYPSARISAVADGMKALLVYDQEGADLLITDHDMPRLPGLDLVTLIRSRHATIPIVMISAATTAAPAYAAGVTAFLAKPFSITQLMQVLTSLLPA
jgi:CheY-like chemotaxis protein